MLIKSEKIIHTIAAYERCGAAVEIIPSRQWYIDILTEKDKFLKAADAFAQLPA